MIFRQFARERSERTFELVGAGNRKTYRFSTGRQEQPIVRNALPRGDGYLVRANIQRFDFGV